MNNCLFSYFPYIYFNFWLKRRVGKKERIPRGKIPGLEPLN